MEDPFVVGIKQIAKDPTNAQQVAQAILDRSVYGDIYNRVCLQVYEHPNILHHEVFYTSIQEVVDKKYNDVKEKFKSADPKTAGGGHGRWISFNASFKSKREKI